MLQAPRGTKDIFADELYLWNEVENKIRDIFYRFNFDEIRTPIFESTDLFNRSVGENSDIAKKEMYTFLDKSGRSLTLKPEGTAPIVRSAIQNNLFLANPKLFYFTPAFRYERPQAGRYREFYQCGCEFFGLESSNCDAELISLAYEILTSLGIKNVNLKLNSIGCEKCRQNYNSLLKKFLADNIQNLCLDCKKRFDSNPLRILDCKNKSCKKILSVSPSILETLCDDCKNHFNNVQTLLNDLGVPFQIDDKIVRGLDYYTKTVFEFIHDNIAICGGGRYDNLVLELGGPKICAVGFAFGFERLISILQAQNLFANCKKKLDLFIASIGLKTLNKSQIIANNLRKKNFAVEYNTIDRSIKSQIKTAAKLNANYLIVIGENELNSDSIKIKNMNTRVETQIEIENIDKFLALEEKQK